MIKFTELKMPLAINLEEMMPYLPSTLRYWGDDKEQRISNDSLYGSKGNIVLYFYKPNENGEFTYLISDLSGQELAILMQNVPEPTLSDIKNALKGTMFAIPKITDELRIEMAQKTKDKDMAEVKYKQDLARYKALGQKGINGAYLNPENTRGVLQNELDFVFAGDEKHVLATIGADSCVIVTAYAPGNAGKAARAAMFHADSFSDVGRGMRDIARTLDLKGDEKVDLHIRSGSEENGEIFKTLFNLVQSDARFIIKSCCLGSDNDGRATDLALDVNTGKIITQFHVSQIDMGENVSHRMRGIELTVAMGEIRPLDNGLKQRERMTKKQDENTTESKSDLSFDSVSKPNASAKKPKRH